jgi:tryptophanyl-tRNA synthetase
MFRYARLHARNGYRQRAQYQQHCSISQVIFSGIQPTGIPHLGNLLGALEQWVRLQNEASSTTQLFFSIADLHALTCNKHLSHLRLWKRQMLATLIAVGLNPERSVIFYQSSVQRETSTVAWKVQLTDAEVGTGTCWAYVDTELQCLCWLLVSNDAMEGAPIRRRISSCSAKILMVSQRLG